MEDPRIAPLKRILIDWNPLGGQAAQVKGLNGYETEVTDILYFLDSDPRFFSRPAPEVRLRQLIQGILNEAFDLWLSEEACAEPARKFMAVVGKK